MQPMSSMQAALLPGVTPGWNDPPPLGTPSAGNRLNRYRRVVDPSLSAGAGASPSPYASPQAGMPIGTPQGMQQMHMQQPQLGYGMPEMSQGAPASMPAGYGNQYGYGTPEMAAGYAVQQQPMSMQPLPPQQQPLQSMSPYGATSTVPPMMHQHPVSYGGAPPSATGYGTPGSTVISPPPTGYGHPQGTVAAPPSNLGAYGDYSASVDPSPSLNQKPMDGAEMVNQYSAQPPVINMHSKPPLVAGSSLDDSSLIFEPPNAVHGHTDQRLPTLPDPATYRAPSKAPGDVSLHPQMLVQFLVKAAFRLPIAKCQGVQLKLYHLQQQIESTTPSENFNKFIMKLNYVVDAIDGERYEEASSYLDALSSSFHQECRQGEEKEKPWMNGLRLMLSELRRPNSRMGSANGRPY